MLKEYSWPGNVRELKNIVERAMLFSDGNTIEVTDIPLKTSPFQSILNNYHSKEYPSLHEIEDTYIKWVLEKTKGNKHLASKILKINRKTIARRLNNNSSEK